MAPHFEISKFRSLVDELIEVKLLGIDPVSCNRITIYSYVDEKNIRYSSMAYYLVDAATSPDYGGTVDLGSTICVGGSYRGVEPMAFIWALRPEPGSKGVSRLLKRDSRDIITVHLEAYPGHMKRSDLNSANLLCTTRLERSYLSPTVDRIPITHGRLRGTLFLPVHPGTFPGVIDLSGLVGGLIEARAALLATKGYATFALAYFGYDDLPDDFNEPDMVYFEEAVDYLLGHPRVHGDRVGAIGLCKGGEVVLLMASLFGDKIAGAIVVNSYPYIIGPSYRYYDEFISGKNIQNADVVLTSRGMSLKESLTNEDIRDHVYPVERSPPTTQFLLVKCLDDRTVPLNSANVIADRLASVGRTNYQVLNYSGAGHLFEPPFAPVCDSAFSGTVRALFCYGGFAREHHRAQVHFWGQIEDFLANVLSPTLLMPKL